MDNQISCIISIGSNLGDRLSNLQRAVDLLAASSKIKLLKCSSIYESKAMLPEASAPQADYLNIAVEISTRLSPEELLEFTRSVESKLKRPAMRPKNSPRTVDLDIIFYDDVIMMTDELEIPHPRLAIRRFVLAPICEIAPDIIDPLSGMTVKELLKRLDDSGKATYTSLVGGMLSPSGGKA